MAEHASAFHAAWAEESRRISERHLELMARFEALAWRDARTVEVGSAEDDRSYTMRLRFERGEVVDAWVVQWFQGEEFEPRQGPLHRQEARDVSEWCVRFYGRPS